MCCTTNLLTIDSNNDLEVFSIVGTTPSTDLVALSRNFFPDFNQKIVISSHPALIVLSNIMCYDIIFGSKFVDKYPFHLDWDANKVKWMGYVILLCDTQDFSCMLVVHPTLLHLTLTTRLSILGRTLLNPMQFAFKMPNMNKLTSMKWHLVNNICH